MIDRPYLDFLLHDWLDLESLLQRPAFAAHDSSSVAAFLDIASRLATDRFLSHYKESDRIEPSLEDGGVRVLPAVQEALQALAESGFFAAPFPASVDGLDVPEIVHAASLGTFMAANIATASYAMLTVANARLLLAHGSPAQVDAFARPQIAGSVLGTMCLSEPQAGSSLGDIRTQAVMELPETPLGPRYRLRGNKMWISGGDHDVTGNIFHLVLAKIPDETGKLPAGTAGISLFIVPKILITPDDLAGEQNDIAVAGLNHKMGYRAISNCLLNFGEGSRFTPGGKAGAIGYLVGEPGEGLAIMFHMMNEARINVGLGAASVAMRSHALSVTYARERLQGRSPDTPSASPPQPLNVHPDVQRMLMTQKCQAEGALSLVLFCARLMDERRTAPDEAVRQDAARLLDLLTPAAKSWSSEQGCKASDLAIQIHGGYGYTRDFDVEQLYRDNRLNPVHEGTTGIQGIDFLGRKLARDDGTSLDALEARMLRTADSAMSDDTLARLACGLLEIWRQFRSTATALTGTDRSTTLWHSTAMLAAFGHIVVGWILLDQCLTKNTDASMTAARRATCRFFHAFELPRIVTDLQIARRHSPDIAAMAADLFCTGASTP